MQTGEGDDGIKFHQEAVEKMVLFLKDFVVSYQMCMVCM